MEAKPILRRMSFFAAALVFISLANPVGALAGGRAPPVPAAPAGAEHEFLSRATQRHKEAEAALIAAQTALEEFRQSEGRLRRESLARTGSWIEPAPLWRKKMALEQAVASRRALERKTFAQLSRARSEARLNSERVWSKSHAPSWFSSWWQW
ncbi:hypothetical protein WOC76_03025 [Methylocystis sp. IM3]|uniref:hypothetical protein n=1 Tax=unclassified Methylocystis TaxID=2625913 RepID=UPI000FB68AE1|nr:MAG: hypothetical protein EKK29_16790 [Hyphomicrobiales bacterium]